MGRSPCCLRRGAWTVDEDTILCEYIQTHGEGGWTNVAQKTDLKRSGKSCRLRWLNYLRPDIKRGSISPDEDDLIIRLHRLLGNRWALIAGRLPERTDNEIKNYWNTHLSKLLALKESQPKTRNVKELGSKSQPKKTRNVKELGSKSPPPVRNHVFKPTPVKITTAVRHAPNGCDGDGRNESFVLSNVKETMDSSMACCDILPKDWDNLVETEGRNTTCSMFSIADQRSPHSHRFPANLAENLVSPHCNLLYSPLDCSLVDFGSEELYTGQFRLAAETIEYESHQSNMQRLISFTITEDQGLEEFYDNIQQQDWIPEISQLHPE